MDAVSTGWEGHRVLPELVAAEMLSLALSIDDPDKVNRDTMDISKARKECCEGWQVAAG